MHKTIYGRSFLQCSGHWQCFRYSLNKRLSKLPAYCWVRTWKTGQLPNTDFRAKILDNFLHVLCILLPYNLFLKWVFGKHTQIHVRVEVVDDQNQNPHYIFFYSKPHKVTGHEKYCVGIFRHNRWWWKYNLPWPGRLSPVNNRGIQTLCSAFPQHLALESVSVFHISASDI